MADVDPAKTSRDKLLDDLDKAFDGYFKQENKRIDAEAGFARAVLKARSGSSSLAKANVARSKVLLINDLGTFLTG